MKKLDLVTKTVTDALGYEITKAKIEGLVVEVDTTDGEHFDILIFQRPISQMQDACFALSSEGLAFAKGCKCDYIANIYGRNKACGIVVVDAPDIECNDEWGEEVRIYANPLHDA